MISVQNVSKKFGDLTAVDQVSFEIKRGEVVGFLGPNGAGKSTTMRMITGFLTASSGKIRIDGQDIVEHPILAKNKIGYLPESAAIYTEMEVTDYLTFMGKMRGLKGQLFRDRLKFVVKECQLKSVLGRKIHDISKGFRQRVGLAQALIHDPEILILDEPTVGLDPNQIVEIRELIKEIGKSKTILLSTHILPEVAGTCQRVLIINRGKIVLDGHPENLSTGEQKKTRYRVGIRGELAAIQREFCHLPESFDVVVESSVDDRHQLFVDSANEQDQSEEIFDRAVKNNWRLFMLTREKQSLEDVFKDITK